MKLNTGMSMMRKEMAEATAGDFSSWEGKIDPSVVAQVKSICDAELATAMAALESSDEGSKLEKEVMSAFTGSDGLLELASKEEKAAEAGLLQCISDMEKLEVDVAGVADVTIGEILDREPELRAEIEEEIKNNVWAP